MKRALLPALLLALGLLAGCEPQGANLEKAEPQPPADLEAGAKAQTLEQWSAANPNNGAPGHGEAADK